MTDAMTAVTSLTGETAVRAHPLTGTVCQVRLASGRTVVAKRGTGTDMVAAEAASLRWLADADAVGVPAILGQDANWLVIERIEAGRPTADAAEEFGRRLAALHASDAPAFGQPPPDGPRDAWIGMAAMVNVPAPDWPAWYAESRIRPYLRRCAAAGTLSKADVAIIDNVADRVAELAGPAEPPARLHGDLWNGNVVWGADGHAWLIDPAAHGGHRETDLAMLALFGCPHLNRVLAAYREVAPLADGWADRVPLHQLFPLLVHTELFGGGYAAQAVAAARAC
ncbi:MAG TPA: fructosamine kinase family protein [Pseudonocardiaceae bacterium]|nr:fructosamine kinase family protein [Pseudonocardiaceae bacterium]